MSPTFPLSPAPDCSICNFPARRDLTNNPGSNGRRRPYYFCSNNHARKFIRWDDSEGISNDNPRCRCGHHSRLNSGRGLQAGRWYDCSSMSCSFRENAIANADAVELESRPSVSPPSTYQSSSQGSYQDIPRSYGHRTSPRSDRYVQYEFPVSLQPTCLLI